MKSLFAALLGAVLACTGSLRGAQEPQLSEEGRQALWLLARAEVFRDVRVGFTGELSSEVRAFRTLMRQPPAAAVCRWLVEHATFPGRLYGLCGLYFTDHAHFLSLLEEHVHKLPGRVQVQNMCVSRPMPTAWVVASILNGWYPEQFCGLKRWRLSLVPTGDLTLSFEPSDSLATSNP